MAKRLYRSDCNSSSVNCGFACNNCPQKKFSLFKDLNPFELDILNKNKKVFQLKKGDLLFQEGSKIMGLYSLHSGKISEYKTSLQRKMITLSLKKPVDFIGLSDLFSSPDHQSSAIALESTTVCNIDRNNLLEVLEGNADLSFSINCYLSREMSLIQNHLVYLTQKHMRGRLAYGLLYIKDFYGILPNENIVNVSLKRSELASLTNMTTENVIRTLKSFEEEGLIKLTGRKLSIIEQEKLKKVFEVS